MTTTMNTILFVMFAIVCLAGWVCVVLSGLRNARLMDENEGLRGELFYWKTRCRAIDNGMRLVGIQKVGGQSATTPSWVANPRRVNP